MSLGGHFLPIEGIGGASALLLIATELLRHSERRKGPSADIGTLRGNASLGATWFVESVRYFTGNRNANVARNCQSDVPVGCNAL
jgi:hypothetical protein